MKESAVKYIFISLLSLLLFVNVRANSDSLRLCKFIEKGAIEFSQLKEQNEEYICNGEYDKLNFILSLSPDTTGNYVKRYTLNGKEPWLTQTEEIASLNSKLRKVYFEDSVECYLILINYFDLIIKAEAPGGLTMNDLFNTGKFYDQNSNVVALKAKHDSITNGIISGAIKNANRNCIVMSYANYSGKLNGYNIKKYAYFTQKLVKPTNTSSPFLETVNDVLKKKMHDCVDPRYKCGNNVGIAEVAVDQFVSAVTVAKCKALILSTYTMEGLAFLLDKFKTNNDYYGLSLAERLHILGVFVNDQMVGSYSGMPGPEGWAVKVIRYTNQEDVVKLLRGLEKSSVLNSDNNYQGDKSNNDAMIYRLVSKIDDGFIGGLGGDNYKALNQALADKVLSSKEVRDSFSTTTPGNISDRMIYWDETYTITTMPIGHNNYEVTFNEDGSVTYKRSVVDHYEVGNMNVIPVFDHTYPEVRLKPFDIVVFVNNTNCTMITAGGAGKGQLNFMPALFLKYANDKAFNETTMKIVATTADVVTLASGPGLLFKAARAGRIATALFEAANTIGAGANLTMNLVNVQNPKVRGLLDEFNTVVGIWGLTRLGVNGAFKLGNALDAMMDESKMISSISQDEARTYIQAYDDAKDQLGILLPGDKERLNKLMKLLEKGIENVPPSSTISSVEQFIERIPLKYRNRVLQEDFTQYQLEFIEISDDDLFRYWDSQGGSKELGQWLTKTHYTEEDAKKMLALPNTNDAKNVTKFRVSKRIPCLRGPAASKANDLLNFGSYATGTGDQIYILFEDIDNLVKIQ